MRRVVASLLLAALIVPLISIVLSTAAHAQEPPATGLRGQLRLDDEPIEGVTILVEQDGNEIDEVVERFTVTARSAGPS